MAFVFNVRMHITSSQFTRLHHLDVAVRVEDDVHWIVVKDSATDFEYDWLELF